MTQRLITRGLHRRSLAPAGGSDGLGEVGELTIVERVQKPRGW